MSDTMQKVLMALGVVLVAGLLWAGLVSPARDDADTAKAAQAQAETQAQAVAGQLASSRLAAERAPANARTLRRLARAVPEKVESPALIDQLDAAAERHDVSFDVLKVTNATASAATPATGTTGAAGAAGTPAGAAADGTAVAGTPATPSAPAGSVPVELNVELAGTYVDVTRFVEEVQDAVRTSGSDVRARGRLLRIESVDLAAKGEGSGRVLKGTLALVAYLLPKDSAAVASAPVGAAATQTTTGSQP